MTTLATAVAYLRVSTDDKGQDPERQLVIMRPWAEREGVTILDKLVDEGTSASKTNPYERPKFIAACERAVALGATAIVVECCDRFSRQGAKADAWAEVELERRYGLLLYRADKTLDAHGSMVGDVGDAINASGAQAWVKAHSSKVRSGMAKAIKEGRHVGRPRKVLSDAELAQARTLHDDGKGWRAIALVLSTSRGAFAVADPKKRKALTVSHTHVRDTLVAVRKSAA